MDDADLSIVERDPDLPVLGLLLDTARLDEELAAAAGERAWSSVEVERLRYKVGTSVQASVALSDDAGPVRRLRVAGYRRGRTDKLRKDIRWARSGGGLVANSESGSWSAVAPWADRHLGIGDRLAGHASDPSALQVLSYNPARRLVVRPTVGDGTGLLMKVHAPGTSKAPTATLHALAAAGAPIVPTSAESGGTVRWSSWVDGRVAGPDVDGDAVADALELLDRAAGGVPARTWSSQDLSVRAGRALRTVGSLLPALAGAASSLAADLDEALRQLPAGATSFLHGDLSPDQVIVPNSGGPVVLIDLDDCGRGPGGWDRATWLASQVATGSVDPVPLPGPAPHPTLLSAALAIRSPEPFQRRRVGWARTIESMLAMSAAGLRARGGRA
ncbi:MAG: phosphotransferase [Acidimicrobiales bacterium]|nr:phosphotransferase [Acidimicrobiales bacterium]